MNRNITATILIVLAVGIYATYTRGVWADASSVKSVNDSYASAIDNAQKLISVRDQVLKSYNDISADDRDRIDKMVPDTVDNIRLIIDLNSVALQHGFSLKNITAAAKSDSSDASPSVQGAPALAPSSVGLSPSVAGSLSIATPTLDTVTVSFSVTAPYQQFISFMQDLEASLRVMDLTHLTVSANDTGTYDFGVQLTTYWLRQ
jgi:Tfp pilus assembly protein PilO